MKNRGQCKYTRAKKSQEQKDYPGQHHWLELDNNPTNEYLQKFEQEKIVWTAVNSEYKMTLVSPGCMLNNALFMITGEHLQYILGVFNSILIKTYFQWILSEEYQYGSKEMIRKLSIPKITPQNKHLAEQIERLVDQILQLKKQDKNADTKALEAQIDKLVFELYGLSDEEREAVIINDL